MGDSNMDFENTENLTISEEDPSPILSSGIREVFYVFASMLDIKSFMRLAMASKTMYNRCMNDKMIRINIEEKELIVMVPNNVPHFFFDSSIVTVKNTEKYLERLRQMKCSISLERIVFYGGDIVSCQTNSWQEVISFIKDLHLKNVEFDCSLPKDILRSSFQLNLRYLRYTRSVRGELLLEMNSSIPHIRIHHVEASTEVFTQILWKIQSGALKKLSQSAYFVKWDEFVTVSSDLCGPLPAERPLLIVNGNKRWFLHWDGGVTKCEVNDPIVEFSKCEKDDFPLVLQSKEKVHKSLAEGSLGCRNVEELRLLFEDFELLSDHPPLIFEKTEIMHTCEENPEDCDCIEEEVIHITWGANEDHFLSLNEDPDPVYLPPALKSKEMLEYILEHDWNSDEWRIRWYGSSEDFISYFESHEVLDFKHEGRLPNTHPLVFRMDSSYLRENGLSPDYWFLRRDGLLIECEWKDSHVLLTVNPKYGHPRAIYSLY